MSISPLSELSDELRTERTVVAASVVESSAEPVLGHLVAGGTVGRRDPDGYAYVIEAVYEGYLLHYGRPRIIGADDPDLALLAGDYLYALGLGRLAEIGDSQAVAALADLISMSAACHAEGATDALLPLWLATAVSVAGGEGRGIMEAGMGAGLLDSSTVRALWRSAEDQAQRSGMQAAFRQAQNAIDFPAVEGSNLG